MAWVKKRNLKSNSVGTDQLEASAITGAKISNATIENAKLANSTIQAGKISFFKSTEQTANGSAQNVAHGLGRTPSLVFVTVTELPAGLAGGFDIAEGTHDGTNVVVTITNGCKYRVVAL